MASSLALFFQARIFSVPQIEPAPRRARVACASPSAARVDPRAHVVHRRLHLARVRIAIAPIHAQRLVDQRDDLERPNAARSAPRWARESSPPSPALLLRAPVVQALPGHQRVHHRPHAEQIGAPSS